MYLIPSIRREGTLVRVALSELRVGYEAEELKRWQRGKCQLAPAAHARCVPPEHADRKKELLRRFLTGEHVFGRPPSAYWDQANSTWPAFRWAQYLHEKYAFDLTSIVSEAWHASARASGYSGGAGRRVSRHGPGTATLKRFLPESFFHDFATLVEENAGSLPGPATRHDLNVDIFAGKPSEWCFFEVARDNGTVAVNQRLFLAFAAFLLHRHVVPVDGATPWRVGLVRFDSGLRAGVERESPEAILQEFRIPDAWTQSSVMAA